MHNTELQYLFRMVKQLNEKTLVSLASIHHSSRDYTDSVISAVAEGELQWRAECAS